MGGEEGQFLEGKNTGGERSNLNNLSPHSLSLIHGDRDGDQNVQDLSEAFPT